MDTKSRLIGHLALAAAAAGLLFASTANAASYFMEAHACKADSDTGGNWPGSFYFPGTRSARTVLMGYTAQSVFLQATLHLYFKGGSTYTQVVGTHTVPPGSSYGAAEAMFTDAETAPGHLMSMHTAWAPPILRYGNLIIGGNEPIESNGCINRSGYF